jgi:hypothetical protein
MSDSAALAEKIPVECYAVFGKLETMPNGFCRLTAAGGAPLPTPALDAICASESAPSSSATSAHAPLRSISQPLHSFYPLPSHIAS